MVARGLSEDDVGELASRFDVGWLSQAVAFYNEPQRYLAMPAEGGPAQWQRVSSLSPTDGVAIEPAVVSDIVVGTDRVDFKVDRTGVPVLVKVSYFPNWSVSGAEGPWRIGPNLMVVVPTDNEVHLSYGNTGVEYLGYLLTLLGLVGLVVVSRRFVSRPVIEPSFVDEPSSSEVTDVAEPASPEVTDVAEPSIPRSEMNLGKTEGPEPEAPSSQ